MTILIKSAAFIALASAPLWMQQQADMLQQSDALESISSVKTSEQSSVAYQGAEAMVDICTLADVVCEHEITARISKYSRKDSCHYPGCITASGKPPKEGKTVACPRHYKLGTVVMIAGKKYTCEDRYALWVDEKLGTTFDIFTEDYNSAVAFGSQQQEVLILSDAL